MSLKYRSVSIIILLASFIINNNAYNIVPSNRINQNRRAFVAVSLSIPTLVSAAEPDPASVKALQAGISDLYSDKIPASIPQLESALSDPNWAPLEKGSILRLLGDATSSISDHPKSFQYYSSAVSALNTISPTAVSEDDLPTYNSELSQSLIGKSRAYYGHTSSPPPSTPLPLLASDLKLGLTLSCTSSYEDDLLLCGSTKNPYLLWELARVTRDSQDYKTASYYFNLASKIFLSQGDTYRSYICSVDSDICILSLGSSPPKKYVIEDGVKNIKSRQIVYITSKLSGDVTGASSALDFKFEKVTGQKRGWTIDDDVERLKEGPERWKEEVGPLLVKSCFS
ncbi:hypothetical protein TrST_g12161 [Triparma strigata]|uniref:Uncharacterized protein n=1 Tax=Triparma strigata TaxID=1606541 RepID=A0A9W7AW92_9STRA|nr:hypothetical protein TrST_g12161 [Triparma strigata]